MLSTERGIIDFLMKLPKISGDHQSAFEGQVNGKNLLQNIIGSGDIGN